jgi:hypothetical protein
LLTAVGPAKAFTLCNPLRSSWPRGVRMLRSSRAFRPKVLSNHFILEVSFKVNSQRNDTSVSFSVSPRAWFEGARSRDRSKDLLDYRDMRRYR